MLWADSKRIADGQFLLLFDLQTLSINSIHYEVSGIDPHICFVLYISMQKHYSTKTVQHFDNGNCNVST